MLIGRYRPPLFRTPIERLGSSERLAQGTIEERILALQERKAQLAGSLYSETGAEKGPLFTESDVAQLLQPLFIQ